MNIRMVPALSGRANPVIMGELTCQISWSSSTAIKEAGAAVTQPLLLSAGHGLCSDAISNIRVSQQNFDDAFRKVFRSVSRKVRWFMSDPKTFYRFSDCLNRLFGGSAVFCLQL